MCGPVTVAARGGRVVAVRGRQPQTVLAYLALEDRPVQREELAEVLWGEHPGEHWPGALRGVLSRLRATLVEAGLDPGTLRARDATVSLEVPGGVVTDAGEAEAAVGADGHSGVAAAEAARTLARPFLPHEDGDWSRSRREWLAGLAALAAHRQVEGLLADGRFADAAQRARARVAEDPLDEAAHHLLIEALVADGRGPEAVRAYASLTEVLLRELGIRPSPATEELVRELRRPRAVTLPDHAAPPGPPGPTERFVGRHREQAVLEGAWRRVVDRHRPEIVLIEGPAGMGKTRLADHLCARLDAEGARVLWGRERVGPEVAYGSLAEAVRAAVEVDPEVLELVGPRGCGLVGLLPHLAERFEPYRPPDDPAIARSHVFDAAVATVSSLARQPTVLVLDDLHWAADDTMALLEAILDGLERPLLVVATTRPTPEPSAAAVTAIHRIVPVTSVELDPLEVGELAELLTGVAPPTEPDLELARALHARTGGLPYFVTEIVRAARQVGRPVDADSVPSAVVDWIERRVASLPPSLARDLELAAVVGGDIDLDLLRRAGGRDPEDLARSCDELIAHGLLTTTGAPGVVAFSHALTRDAVYGRVGPAQRAHLHRVVADSLAERAAAPDHDALVAHHYLRAGPAARTAAAAYALAAGHDALARGAWDQARARFDASLRAAEAVAARARALTGLGRALQGAGRFDDARASLHDAVDLAWSHGLPLELAEATLTLVGRAGRGVSPPREQQTTMLRRALDAVVADDPDGSAEDRQRRSALLVHLERELATALLLADAVEERAALAERAVQRARSLPRPDAAVLAAGLLASRVGASPPEPPGRRLRAVEEVLALPSRRLTPELLLLAHCYRHEDLLQLGDRHAAAAALDAADEVAASYPDPYWVWALGTWRALGRMLDGDLQAAEAAAIAASEALPGVEEAVACLGVNLVNIRLFQGRAGEVVDLLAADAERQRHIPCYRAVLALCESESGRSADAAADYRHFAEEGFTNLPADSNRFLGLVVLAHVAADLGDRRGGEVLAGLLAAHAGEQSLLNCYGGGGAAWGPVTDALARLAALAGCRRRADELFDQALAEAEAAGMPVVVERIRAHRAGS